MKRATFVGLSAIAFWLFATATALAQPKLILTQVSSDLTGDGNTVVGTILDENVHGRITTFTRGTGFAFPGPSVVSQDGRLQISDINAGVFSASSALYNGSFGSQF